MDRIAIANLILDRMESNVALLTSMYEASKSKIGYFYIDDLLPQALAREIFSCFPAPSEMRLKKSIREYKYIAAQMDNYDPILEEAVYAFQDPRIVAFISRICGIKNLTPDEHLYAGGISMMSNGHYLNPHLDNSHDKDREKWRVLNLLYYVTPDWPISSGGNLELWSDGVKKSQVTIHSKFNRLAVMATHGESWHSVSPISYEKTARCCVSNYYFSEQPLKKNETFHITAFRGRPEQKLRDIVLQADIKLRMLVRKIIKKGVVKTSHLYKK